MSEREHKLHIELWMWLAANPDKEKREWPRWATNGGDIAVPTSLCFACVAAVTATVKGSRGRCLLYCPLDWGTEKTCMTDGSIYRKWSESSAFKKRSSLAKKIANLPWEEKE